MQPIRTLLVDDHQDSLEILAYFVQQHQNFNIIETAQNGEELIEKVITYKPELVIADINMPKLTGVEAIKKCLKIFPDLKCIFVTGYDDYAVEAFDMSAVDYIVKPVERTRLHVALERAFGIIRKKELSLNPGENKRLPIKFNGSLYYIPMKDIYFIEKLGKKCMIHTKKNIFETYENISDIYQMLDETFYLTHRSNIINLDKISHITPRNETYLVYFIGYDQHASISKLKIMEVQELMSARN